MINDSKAPCFELNLYNYPNSFHFIGYRLKEDKYLSVTIDGSMPMQKLDDVLGEEKSNALEKKAIG